jgi:hypothetical protein
MSVARLTSVRVASVAAAVVAVLGLTATPAAAAPPESGTVVEGTSVPGVALGATRAQAENAWGPPTFCQSGSRSGDNALCTWQGLNGAVDLSFLTRKGKEPTGKSTDVVAGADWSGFAGWVTTAEVTAPQALNDPESVPPAYPKAEVYRYGDGHLAEVIDKHLGIEVLWTPMPYTGEFVVTMRIFLPHG